MRPLVFLVFFLSGFVALLDQVVWQRILGLFSGGDLYAVTIVVAAFMAGLGCGSLAGGHLADRIRPATALLYFAAAELGIGLFGLASKALYYDIVYVRLGHLPLPEAIRAFVLFLAVLPPTFAMGLSLPLLTRALTRTVRSSAPTVGGLYGVNTLGAAVGAALTTWVLVRRLGLTGTLAVGAAGNLLCAAAALPLALLVKREVGRSAEAASDTPNTYFRPDDSFRFPTWVLLFGLSGFIALSLEVVWFRLLGVAAKSTAFTFGTLLAIYLLGLGLGISYGALTVGRSVRPARAFLRLQASAGLYAGFALVAFLGALSSRPLDFLRSYLAEPEPLDVAGALAALGLMLSGGEMPPAAATLAARFLATYVLLPALLVGPSTFLLGASFPFLQRAVQTDLVHLGRRVGWLQAANIAGSLVGVVLTGFILLAVLGTAGTLRLLVAASGVFLLALAGRALSAGRARRRLLAGAAVVLVALAILPDAARLWAKLHGTTSKKILFEEDGSGLSLLKLMYDDPEGLVFLFGNGLSQSWIPYGSVHTLLGAIPVLVHPAPVDVAVIGLGSGDTLFHLGARREIRAVTCIEIIESQRPVLESLARARPYAALRSVLRDPRIRFVDGDGRAYLKRGTGRFDLIEADALRPTSALSGNLYSTEYFELMRDRLKPGGIAVTWTATGRVLDTFVSVFPHVVWIGDVLLGSREPIPYDPAIVRQRLEDPFTRSYLARAGGDVSRAVMGFLESVPAVRFGPDHDRAAIQDVNTDLYPKDEFHLRRYRR